jgi:predicted PolB exonuclease-like 3'-5' exonuclease
MIYVDIETIPTERPEIIERVTSKLSAPSNYKDPEKIEAYIEAQKPEAVHKTGLSGLFGQVLMIGFAFDDEPVKVIREGAEADILQAFRNVACRVKSQDQEYCTNTLVGHNILGFDAPFLSQRMMINGLKPLFRHGGKPWDMPIDDTMTMFACGTRTMYSLENLCLAFGVPTPKGEMTGSSVYDYYKEGRIDEIAEYCARDVEATRAIYKKMVGL